MPSWAWWWRNEEGTEERGLRLADSGRARLRRAGPAGCGARAGPVREGHGRGRQSERGRLEEIPRREGAPSRLGAAVRRPLAPVLQAHADRGGVSRPVRRDAG